MGLQTNLFEMLSFWNVHISNNETIIKLDLSNWPTQRWAFLDSAYNISFPCTTMISKTGHFGKEAVHVYKFSLAGFEPKTRSPYTGAIAQAPLSRWKTGHPPRPCSLTHICVRSMI